MHINTMGSYSFFQVLRMPMLGTSTKDINTIADPQDASEVSEESSTQTGQSSGNKHLKRGLYTKFASLFNMFKRAKG